MKTVPPIGHGEVGLSSASHGNHMCMHSQLPMFALPQLCAELMTEMLLRPLSTETCWKNMSIQFLLTNRCDNCCNIYYTRNVAPEATAETAVAVAAAEAAAPALTEGL